MSALTKQVAENLTAAFRELEAESEAPSKSRKEHTYCFMCARTYFSRILERCTRCASRSVQHYTSHDLSLLGHRAL